MILPTDRWLEMDLTWFDPTNDLRPQMDTLLGRIAPLLLSVSGDRGICFNVGWLIDLATEWTGDPQQNIPTQSRRTTKWAAQSYATLQAFVGQLRTAAVANDLPDLKIGVLFVGWSHVVWPPELKIYDFDSAWYARHPELYAPPKTIIGMPDLHPINRLHSDDYPYAAFPNGLSEGTYFAEFFGEQWGHLADYLNFDLLLLRDGLTGPMIYTRNGPYGTSVPPDPEIVAKFSQSVRDLYKYVKQASPSRLVFGYSSGISPVADWRVGCVDFEALVADGYIDGWIEQTWGGAWQDWWHQLWKGWTFQTANLLTRGAMIASANQRREKPCRFYNLIETWDGWEPWDTLHQVPHKLRWGMWAFTHAAVKTPDGLKIPDGSYISWVNNGAMELLSDADVEYVNTNLNAAQANALRMDRVYGYALVYNRAMMEWLSAHHPDWNASEWIDDQAAMLMKWGVPILSGTRMEWLDNVQTDGLVAQTPGRLKESQQSALLDPSALMLATGRANLLDEAVKAGLGLTTGDLIEADFHVAVGEEVPPFDRPYLPEHITLRTSGDTEVIYATHQTPLITRHANHAYWQPPDWSEPFNQFVPKYQLGSTFPHFRTARLLHEMACEHGLSYLANIQRSQPIAFHLWRSGGDTHFLLGNLETGEFGDSRTLRTVHIHLSRSQLGLSNGDYALARVDVSETTRIASSFHDEDWLVFRVVLEPEQSAVWVVTAVKG